MSIGAYLRLIRPPNVFTAFADSMAGLLVIRALGVPIRDGDCALIAASGCLYLAGIVLNDVFDREVDAIERPGRPIPSGEVPVGVAALIGLALLAGGVALAFGVSRDSGLVATALASAIVAYDVGVKRTSAGPLVMGSCRTLNFGLGMTPALAAGHSWCTLAAAGPIALGLYIAALTYIARDEVGGNTERRARAGLRAMTALAVACVLLLICHPAVPRSAFAWPWVAALLYMGVNNWRPLWHRHDGPTTGRAIGGGIVLIPVFDGAACAVAGEPFWALAVAALIVPAMILKQWFSPT